VTNPERFAPLHGFAAELIDRLESEFDVEHAEADGKDSWSEKHNNLIRPTVLLRPIDTGAASLTISFTSFPGLYVSFGRWVTDCFPQCGCDACNESSEEQIERLQAQVQGLIDGQFQESISILDDGTAWCHHAFAQCSSGSRRVDIQEARRMLASAERSSYAYNAWPKKKSKR
jgi:hypothetical protein